MVTLNSSISGSKKQTGNRLLLSSLLVFLASMMVTSLFWALLPNELKENESSDYLLYYEPVARNILQGRGISLPEGTLATKYPPGYPVLLAGVFGFARLVKIPDTTANAVFLLVCMGISSMTLFRFSSRVWGDRFAWLAPLAFMTYPLVLWLVKQPNSEIPFMVFLYGCIYLYWLGYARQERSWAYYGLAGVFVGAAMLIRPIAIGMGVLLVILLLLSRRHKLKDRLLLGLVLLTGNLLVVLPWQVLVYSNTGSFILLSTGGVTSLRDGLTFAAVSKDYRTGILVPEDVAGLQEEIARETSQMLTFGDVVGAMGGHLVKQPGTVIKLYLIKAARSWYATDSGRFEGFILVIQVFYLSVVAVSLLLAWHHFYEVRPLLLLVGGIVFYFWGMTVFVLSIVRYMTPVISLLFLFLPGAVHYLHDRYLSKQLLSLNGSLTSK